MAKTIDVAVAKGTNFLRWAKNRPARLLPTGYVGAVISGRVMPVYQHRFDTISIDVDDDGYDPDDCPFWKISTSFCFTDDNIEVVDVDDGIDWYLETNTFGHYVVFDGDEETLNDVLSRLAQYGVTIKRHGPSHRPATDGYEYDWFVRLDFDGCQEEAQALVTDALSDTISSSSSASPGELSDTLKLIVSLPKNLMLQALKEGMLQQDSSTLIHWIGTVAEAAQSEIEDVKLSLQKEVDLAFTQLHKLQQTSADLNQAAKLEKLKDEQLIKGLNSEINALRSRYDGSNQKLLNAAELEAENAKLKSDLAEQESIYEEWERLEGEVSSLQAELENARNESKTLIRDNKDLADRKPTQFRASERERKLALSSLEVFSNIGMHADAADTILSNFHDLVPLFDILKRLNNGENVTCSKIRGIKGNKEWFELDKHIHTGQSDMGRIYWMKEECGRRFVVIHHKKNDIEQQRFFKNKLGDPAFLRNLPFG
jgi:hypothetical protein